MRNPSAGTFEGRLVETFGAARVGVRAPLAELTTFGVGGPADWLVEVRGSRETQRALKLAAEAGVPVTVLGGGSNVLIADGGVRGLVLRMHGGDIGQPAPGVVRADAGVTVNGLVRWTIVRGLAGLQRWAGTPGTVGGGIRGNAHFEGHLLGERVVRVGLVSPAGEALDVPGGQMEFAYDQSRPQRTGEVVVWAEFRVDPGEPAHLREVAKASLRFRKRTQPLSLPSAGCVFQNPQPGRDPVPAGVPASAGALIDRAGLKGCRIGGAQVSLRHANFVVNTGGASAEDIRTLVERCRHEVARQFGVELRYEIVFLGEF